MSENGEKWRPLLHKSRASLWTEVSSVPIKISNSLGINSFPLLINSRSPSNLTTGPHSFGCLPSLCFWFISFHYSCPLPDLLPPTGEFLFFCSAELRLFPICFHLCRVSGEKHASHCRGWQTAPGSPEPSFICRNTPAGSSSGRVKVIFTKDHSKQTQTFFCRRGRGNEISRWLQDQFYCGKCLLIISGEWDIDYIDPASCMNWKDIELIRIIQ